MSPTMHPANPALIVPYGSQSVRAHMLDQLRAGQADDLERPGAPVVAIDTTRQKPLRMHDLVHPFTLPPIAQDLAHAQTQLAFLEQHLSRHCGDWAKSSQTFIASYFANLRAEVHENEKLLTDKAGTLAGLVEVEHWCFSALMPLPRAHLYLPDDGRQKDFLPSDFIMVEFVFWNGTELIAVIVDNGNTPTSARKKALKRLVANNIRLQTINMDVLNSKEPLALLTALGPTFKNFWSDISIAHSPFRGRGIDAPVRSG